MKYSSFIFVLVSLFLSLLSSARAEESTPLSPATAIAADRLGEPIKLFNGENLDGWEAYMKGSADSVVPAEPTWSFVDGAIHCEPTVPGYLYYKKNKFDNYVLRLDWRFIKAGNSGVLLRCQGDPQAYNNVWPRSIEAQVNHQTSGDIWNIAKFPMTVDPQRTIKRRTQKMHESNEREIGEWNTYEIVLDGGDLRLIVNGLLQNSATDCQELAGPIALQSETAVIEFRDIVLWPIERPK